MVLGWVGSVVVPRVAHACSCLVAGATVPPLGAVDVPLNTLIWSPGPFGEPTLTREDGAVPVPLTCTNLGTTWMCRPDAPLEPSTKYTTTSASFTTGTTTDTEAPPLPAETARRYYSKNAGGPGPGVGTSCDSPTEQGVVALTMNGGDPLVLVDTSGSTDGAPPTGPITDVVALTGASRGNEVWVGSYICVSNRPGTGPGDRFPIRVGAMDAAGNFSGWTTLEDAEIPPALPGCPGCSATRGDAVVPLLVLVMGWRRRRRA